MGRSPSSVLLVFACATSLALVVSPATAQVTPPSAPHAVMRLDYTGAKGCADADRFHTALIPRVHGWNPLAEDGPWELVVVVTRHGWGYDGSIALRDPKGTVVLRRTFLPATCRDLLDKMAVVVAIRIDPGEPVAKVAAAPVCAPAVVQECPAVQECPQVAAPTVVRQEVVEPARAWEAPSMWSPPEVKPGVRFRGGILAWGERYATNQGSLGLSLDAGVRYGWFSVAIEAHGDPPLGSTPSLTGSLSFARLTGSLIPCLHYGFLDACLKGEAGRILFPIVPAPTAARSYGAVGMRLGLELPMGSAPVSFRLAAEVLFPIDAANATVTRYGQTLYQTALTGGGLGLGVLFAP